MVGGMRARIHAAATGQLESAARFVSRRSSLQRLDTLAMTLSRPWPPLRDYRFTRALAVTGDLSGRDLLARAATKGRLNSSELMAKIDRYREAPLEPSTLQDLRWLRRGRAELLAWLLFQQNLLPEDHARALAILGWARHRWGPTAIAGQTTRTYVELLLAQGQRERARAELPPPDRATGPELRLLADASNPFVPGNGGSTVEQWMELVNAPFREAGMEPLNLTPATQATAFDRLTCKPVPAAASPARVTVVVSSYRPDHRLLAAVKSIAASSWRDLEILVFDDASGPAYASWYTEVASLDPRISVHEMPKNGGTYRIRNRALDMATGTFLTFHDSDDWMHPRRIEIQARHLFDHPSMPANVSTSVRVTENLEFSHPRSLGPKLCEPSLMIRREAVMDKVGYFDGLRKAADAEYRTRIESCFGTHVPVVDPTPLTLQLIGTTSLTDAEIRGYWIHLDRRVHRSCYERWHHDSIARGIAPRLERNPDSPERPFFAPASLGDANGPRTYDVLVAANWLDRTGFGFAERQHLRLIRRLTSAGLDVAIVQVDLPLRSASLGIGLAPRLIMMLNAGTCGYVGPTEAALATVVIAEPGAAAHFEVSDRNIVRARHVITEAGSGRLGRGYARTLTGSVLRLVRELTTPTGAT